MSAKFVSTSTLWICVNVCFVCVCVYRSVRLNWIYERLNKKEKCRKTKNFPHWSSRVFKSNLSEIFITSLHLLRNAIEFWMRNSKYKMRECTREWNVLRNKSQNESIQLAVHLTESICNYHFGLAWSFFCQHVQSDFVKQEIFPKKFFFSW